MRLGETGVKVRVTGPKGSEDLVMVADTGASHTMISNEIARRLGIEAAGTAVAELADGSEMTIGFGRAETQMGDERHTIRVLIGPSGQPLLGQSTLETFGLKVNPVTRGLEPSEYKLYAVAG